MFFIRIPNLCCSLASHDAAPEAHQHRKRRGLMYLYWTDSVCEVLSVWILELCLVSLLSNISSMFKLCSFR